MMVNQQIHNERTAAAAEPDAPRKSSPAAHRSISMRPAALAALLPLSLAQQSIPDPPPGFNVPTLPTGTVRPGSCGETVKGPCAGGAAAAGVAGAWTDDADRPPDLEGCVAKCLACPATKCAYVSYSTTNKDCRCARPH